MEKDWCKVVHQLDNIFQNGKLIKNIINNILLVIENSVKLLNNIK